jgi:hypothetical protein
LAPPICFSSIHRRKALVLAGVLLAGCHRDIGRPPARIGFYRPSAGAFILPVGEREIVGHFGLPYMQPVVGDWKGEGRDSVGVCVNGTCFLTVDPQATVAQLTASFPGVGEDSIGIAGDWTGKGVWTPGMYIPSRRVFLLRDDNASEPKELQFGEGSRGWIPVIGDWDGSGHSQVGLYDGAAGEFHLLIQGRDETRRFGPLLGVPLAGDWLGNGRDDVAVLDRAAGAIFLRLGEAKARVVSVGDRPFDVPVVGRWRDPGD